MQHTYILCHACTHTTILNIICLSGLGYYHIIVKYISDIKGLWYDITESSTGLSS